MRLSVTRPIAAGCLAIMLLCIAQPGVAGSAAAIFAVGGEVQSPLRLSLDELEALPPTTVTVTFTGHDGPESASFTGVLLWTLLDRAGLPAEAGKNAHHLNRTLLAIGHDGYRVALAIGEIDPEFEGKQVIIAYAKDGKPLSGDVALRLIVPGDHRGGRDVRDLERIELK